MEKIKPIKRSAAIVELSKDHHFALLLVWKIREGLKKSIEPSRISNYIIHFFEQELIPHFTAEEELLFIKLTKDNTLRLQAEAEHRNIYGIIDALRNNPAGPDLINQFARALESHVRFEERQLFNYIQESITEEDLSEIASGLKSRTCEAGSGWTDVFWENKTAKK